MFIVQSLVAVSFAAIVSASAGPAAAVDTGKPVAGAAVKSAAASTGFATLKNVKAVPMASGELEAVKGLHIHFVIGSPGTCPGPSCDPVIPSAPADAAPPLEGIIREVNHRENNLGKGQAIPGSGPGYSGMCGAAIASPAIWIPGQIQSTGIGGGC